VIAQGANFDESWYRSFDNYTSTNATFIVLDVKIKKEHPSIVQDVMVTDGKTIGFIYPELLTRIVAE